MNEPLCSVLVPFRPNPNDQGWRDGLWAWNRRRWEMLLPECEVIVSADDGGAHEGQFNHPAAINACAERASSDVFLVADADTAFDPWWVKQACALVRAGEPWVLARFYQKLTDSATRCLLAQPPDADVSLTDDDLEWNGDSCANSGLVVVPRDGFSRAGGYDERWSYWGQDDGAFRITMDVLWGPVVRLEGRCMHLWHPAPTEHTYGHSEHVRQDALARRYIAAAEADDPVEAVLAVRFG